jgi:hypothetical protein
MTQHETDTNQLLRRFAWLCDEIRAGNAVSEDALIRWATQARNNLRAREQMQS